MKVSCEEAVMLFVLPLRFKRLLLCFVIPTSFRKLLAVAAYIDQESDAILNSA